MTEEEIKKFIEEKIAELKKQGFKGYDIFKIIFSCNKFRENFLDKKNYFKLFNEYREKLKYDTRNNQLCKRIRKE